jgi:uncharacterized protein (DUF697 family)
MTMFWAQECIYCHKTYHYSDREVGTIQSCPHCNYARPCDPTISTRLGESLPNASSFVMSFPGRPITYADDRSVPVEAPRQTDSESACCSSIIHTAAATAAGIGMGMAQIPGSDSVPLAALQSGMIGLIAQAHGFKLSDAKAASLLAGFAGTVGGRVLSQILVGWIPGAGNAVNGATAAAVTEAIGWKAHDHFRRSGAEAG